MPEMHCTSGRVLIDKNGHQVAYCAQNPCKSKITPLHINSDPAEPSGLEHATIRDNIIFGSPFPFNDARYQSVLDACALRQDLEIFDAKDMTGTSF